MWNGMMDQIKPIIIILGLTMLAGFADAQGFVHAAQIWQGRKVVVLEVVKSATGFGCGILFYWIVIRYLREYQIAAPEIQALAWFGVTMISVALLSGQYLQWRLLDQLVGLAVVIGIGWLVMRTGA
jgi:hypothetical protein